MSASTAAITEPSTKERSSAQTQGWFLYMIETEGGRLYTGITTDPSRRFEQHRSGKGGAKFFRTDPPKRICFQQPFPDRSTASKQEYRLKRLSRKEKLALIEQSVINIEVGL